MANFTIRDLEKRVRERAGESAEVSYTRKLLDRGVDQCAKKFGEEAVEAAIAAVSDDRKAWLGKPPTSFTICWCCCTPAAFRSTRSRPNSLRAAISRVLRKRRHAKAAETRAGNKRSAESGG